MPLTSNSQNFRKKIVLVWRISLHISTVFLSVRCQDRLSQERVECSYKITSVYSGYSQIPINCTKSSKMDKRSFFALTRKKRKFCFHRVTAVRHCCIYMCVLSYFRSLESSYSSNSIGLLGDIHLSAMPYLSSQSKAEILIQKIRFHF